MNCITSISRQMAHRRVNIHPITRHECPQREQRYSSTLSLISALDGGWVVNATHRPLCPRERASVFIVDEARWPRSRSGRLRLPPRGLKPPNRPDRNELLYRLRRLYTQTSARSRGNEATSAHAFQTYSHRTGLSRGYQAAAVTSRRCELRRRRVSYRGCVHTAVSNMVMYGQATHCSARSKGCTNAPTSLSVPSKRKGTLLQGTMFLSCGGG